MTSFSSKRDPFVMLLLGGAWTTLIEVVEDMKGLVRLLAFLELVLASKSSSHAVVIGVCSGASRLVDSTLASAIRRNKSICFALRSRWCSTWMSCVYSSTVLGISVQTRELEFSKA